LTSTSAMTTASIFFMNIDSRNPGHKVPPGRERRACCSFLNQGHVAIASSTRGRDDAQLFAQSRTLDQTYSQPRLFQCSVNLAVPSFCILLDSERFS
jgi:hypothetical protein